MAAGWRVVGQRATSDLQNGRLIPAMQVDVITDDGTTYQLIIPQAQYTADNVRRAVDEWYERQQGVAGL